MRTDDKISAIKAAIEEPRQVVDFISQEEIDHLISIYDQSKDTQDPYTGKIKKNTGPVTLDIKNYLTDPVVATLIKKLKSELGGFEITAGFWFKTDYPHIIHNDDTFELPDTVSKAITIPLATYGASATPYLCFFDQFYFHGPAKFFNGDQSIPTYYNKQVYEYRDVDGLVNDEFPEEIYKQYFTHLKKSWLKGLSFKCALPWMPGNILIFDSVRLHCASDFRSLGIKEKLAISIFTKK
jgi:hypothetical protein